MDKATIIFEKVCEFMNKHEVDCVESIYQVDSINEASIYLVGKLVEIMLEE